MQCGCVVEAREWNCHGRNFEGFEKSGPFTICQSNGKSPAQSTRTNVGLDRQRRPAIRSTIGKTIFGSSASFPSNQSALGCSGYNGGATIMFIHTARRSRPFLGLSKGFEPHHDFFSFAKVILTRPPPDPPLTQAHGLSSQN